MTTLVTEPRASAVDIFGRSWDGRRVTVVGLGLSGFAAAKLLARLGCRVQVTEARDTKELRSAETLLRSAGVEHVELGGHSERCLEHAELVVVSPGVPEA